MADDGVLIITGSMIGDVILSTGAIGEILRRHPGAKATIVCSPGTAILFRHAPADTEVIPLAKQRWSKHWIDLYRRLRGRSWAAIYDFRGSIVSPFLNGPRSTPRRPTGAVVHKVVEASSILGDEGPRAPVLWLPPADGATTAGRARLVMGPGATRLGKTWPADRFGALAERLTGPGGALEDARVVAVGGPMDKAAAAAIGARLPADRFVDLTGADLLATAAVMAGAALFVGNDSGMMHLSAAAGAPTLGLFGPTDERLYGPWGDRTAVVRPGGVDFVFGKTSKTVSKTESQMDALTVDEVAEASLRLLERTRA